MTRTFTHRLEVRFRDCDPMGHANNAVYLTYLEQARFAHWRAVLGGPIEASFGTGTGEVPPFGVTAPGVIIARVEIDYRRAAKYGETLEIALHVSAVGRTSFTYDYAITDERGGLVATARTVLVNYDYTAGAPLPIPDALRAALTGTGG